MSLVLVLFNLHPETAPANYESWAKTTDLPLLRGLNSVRAADLYRTVGLLGTGESAPYDYVEILNIEDYREFGRDILGRELQRAADQFHRFTDNPIFIKLEPVEA